jgi:hypothetical protein
MDHDENVGWYCDDIGALIEELRDIRSRLATLPVDRVTLNYDDEAQVQKRISDFREIYPQRALNNLYDLNFYFIDGFESLARKALELGRGLVVFY